MKFLPLIWAQLWRRPGRTTFTFLSLVTAFLLLGMLQGIREGFDAMVMRARVELVYVTSAFQFTVPYAYVGQLEKLDGVKVVAPSIGLNGYYQDPKNGMSIQLIDDRFFKARDDLLVTPEQISRWNETRDGLIIGAGTAKRFDIKLGDRPSFRSSNITTMDGVTRDFAFEVTAVIEDKTNLAETEFLGAHYPYINEVRSTAKDRAAYVLLLVDGEDRATKITREIDSLFINSSVPTRSFTERTNMQTSMARFGNISFFVNAIVGSVLFMILFIAGNTMMLAFRERVPEMAVLKTIGFGDNAIAALIVAEALLQSVLGAGIGLLLAKVAMPLLHGKVQLPATILISPWSVIVIGLCAALVVGVVTGFLPAWRARRLTVIEGLAGDEAQ